MTSPSRQPCSSTPTKKTLSDDLATQIWSIKLRRRGQQAWLVRWNIIALECVCIESLVGHQQIPMSNRMQCTSYVEGRASAHTRTLSNLLVRIFNDEVVREGEQVVRIVTHFRGLVHHLSQGSCKHRLEHRTPETSAWPSAVRCSVARTSAVHCPERLGPTSKTNMSSN